MRRSMLIFDNSGSMGSCDKSAHTIATAILSAASPAHLFGFISFNDRVYIQSYYESHPAPLLAKLNALGLPRGRTELMDSLMVALCADDVRPDDLIVISDNGENASEVAPECLKLMLRNRPVRWIKPRPDPLAPPILPFVADPPGRMKLLDVVEAKVDDFSGITNDQKFAEALTKLNDSLR